MSIASFNKTLRETPVIFPVMVLFHWFLVVQFLVQLRTDAFEAQHLPHILWLTVAAILIVFVAFLQRWAAIAYSVLALAGLACRFLLPPHHPWQEAGTSLLNIVDSLVSLFILFFFKRFR